MQKNTKKQGAVISAAVAIGFFLLYLAVVFFAVVSESFGDLIGFAFLALYAAIIGAVIWGIAAALRQRLREIDSGEEEDARKY